jgi:hypothetical protein
MNDAARLNQDAWFGAVAHAVKMITIVGPSGARKLLIFKDNTLPLVSKDA